MGKDRTSSGLSILDECTSEGGATARQSWTRHASTPTEDGDEAELEEGGTEDEDERASRAQQSWRKCVGPWVGVIDF